MTTATLPLVSDYQAVLQDIREVFTTILAEKESEQLAHLPAGVREQLSGHYLGTVDELLALITPDYFKEALEVYDPAEGEPFNVFLFGEVADKLMFLALTVLPDVVGREGAFEMMRFHLEQTWSDKVHIKEQKKE